MEVVADRFRPDPALSRDEMETLQHEVAAAAVFSDDIDFDPAAIDVAAASLEDATPGCDPHDADLTTDFDGDRTGPVVAGVDQAFLDDTAISAVVALQDGRVVDRAHAAVPLSIPYIPGLLSFREGESIIAALDELSVTPDLLVVDGSGRIHFREAGIATHIGVLFDVPAVGVAKKLLCGTPQGPTEGLAAGERVPIEADDSMTAADGTVVGYAYQSRQYPETSTATINPLYVSPGHRLSAATAVDCVAACGGDYKLPTPTRLADRYADRLKADYRA